MPFTPAITDLATLKDHPAVARLCSWNSAAVEGAKFDRDEMTIYVERILHSRGCEFCATTRIVPLIICRT